MAIEMIENNELGAFGEGRLGFMNFADERNVNYGGGEEFFNLFGSRNAKKSAFRDAVKKKYQDLPSDCANIQRSIDLIANDVATLLKQKSNLAQRETLDETNIILGQFKNLQIKQNCEGIAAQQIQEQERASTLATLTQLTDSSVSQAQKELGQQKSSVGGVPTKNLLIYGGVGIVAIIFVALIIKNRK
jgi:hypothetical protein